MSTIEELEAQVEKQATLLNSLRDELYQEKVRTGALRESALRDASDQIMFYLGGFPDTHVVREGDSISVDDLPCPGSVTVVLDSAYDRKESISRSGKFNTWSKSYRDKACVQVTVFIPREDLDEQIDIFERNINAD